MSVKKYQEDLRKIVGLDDAGRRLAEVEDRETIPLSRGVAYFSASGNVAGGNNVPDDAQDDQKDEAQNGTSAGDDTVNDSGTTRNNRYCKDGSLRPYSTGLCPEDIVASTTNYNDLGISVTNGTSVDRIGGLFDCTTGDSARIAFGFDGLPQETAPDPTDPNNLKNLLVDPDTGLPILDENGEAQFNGQTDSQSCIPPPNWESCDCYQREKRGGLKAGWDSVQMWHEAVNCVPDEYFNQGTIWVSSLNYEKIFSSPNDLAAWTVANSGFFSDPNDKQVYANAGGGGQIGNSWLPAGTWPYGLRLKRNDAAVYQGVGWQIYVGSYIGGDPAVEALYQQIEASTEPQQICDQYPEQCENGNTDDESCMPLELLQENYCCEPPPYKGLLVTAAIGYFPCGTTSCPTVLAGGEYYPSVGAAIAALPCGDPFGPFFSDGIGGQNMEAWREGDGVPTYGRYAQGIASNLLGSGWVTQAAHDYVVSQVGNAFMYISWSTKRCIDFDFSNGQNADVAEICGYQCDHLQAHPSDGIQDYTMTNSGITATALDPDVPQDDQGTTTERKFCNDSGQQVTLKPGINGGQLILNTEANGGQGINYYRDPTTGKLSVFSNSQIINYQATSTVPQ